MRHAALHIMSLALCLGAAACGSVSVDGPKDMPDPTATPEPIEDLCPGDPAKLAPGMCGCGAPDFDSDGDGRMDCRDLCPLDANKTTPGECGCGVVDDTDGDGVADCESGCADGRREGFAEQLYQNIAGCGGGFEIRGSRSEGSMTPACDRGAGDDGDNPQGFGCSIADLCAEGWHVCRSQSDVQVSLSQLGSCDDIVPEDGPPLFFLSRQSGPGFHQCGAGGNNDLFGCGNIGLIAGHPSCSPLTRHISDLCAGLQRPWRCGDTSDSEREALVVHKVGAAAGGALCCRD